MADRFSSGKNAIAECDICGFRYKLRELRNVFAKGKDTNTKACSECWSPDHPQHKLGMYPVHDPQAVRDPRVDYAGYAESREQVYSGSNAAKLSFVATVFLGQVTVTTS
jgi:hypothetical protein